MSENIRNLLFQEEKMNTKERISELRKRLMDINYSSTRITAAWWSEEVRAEVGKEKKEIHYIIISLCGEEKQDF